MAKSSAAQLVPLPPPAGPVEASPAALPPLELVPPAKQRWATLAALAIATGLAAVGLGAWVVVSEARSETPAATRPTLAHSLAVLADRNSVRYPLRGSVGRIALVVADEGRAVLTLDGLGRAPAGSLYRAWVVAPGSATPLPAGRFDASERVVPLVRAVPPGARVGVTLEPAAAGDRPSRPLRLVALRA